MNIFKNGVGRPSNNIKRARVIIAVIAVILSATIGYALFSQQVKVTGTATASGTFQITTTCIDGMITVVDGSTDFHHTEQFYSNPSCNVSGNSITATVTLTQPGADKVFTIKYKNTGTINAKCVLSEDSLIEEVYKVNNTTSAKTKLTAAQISETFNSNVTDFALSGFSGSDNVIHGLGTTLFNKIYNAEAGTVTIEPNEAIYIPFSLKWPGDDETQLNGYHYEFVFKMNLTWEQAN